MPQQSCQGPAKMHVESWKCGSYREHLTAASIIMSPGAYDSGFTLLARQFRSALQSAPLKRPLIRRGCRSRTAAPHALLSFPVTKQQKAKPTTVTRGALGAHPAFLGGGACKEPRSAQRRSSGCCRYCNGAYPRCNAPATSSISR